MLELKLALSLDGLILVDVWISLKSRWKAAATLTVNWCLKLLVKFQAWPTLHCFPLRTTSLVDQKAHLRTLLTLLISLLLTKFQSTLNVNQQRKLGKTSFFPGDTAAAATVSLAALNKRKSLFSSLNYQILGRKRKIIEWMKFESDQRETKEMTAASRPSADHFFCYLFLFSFLHTEDIWCSIWMVCLHRTFHRTLHIAHPQFISHSFIYADLPSLFLLPFRTKTRERPKEEIAGGLISVASARHACSEVWSFSAGFHEKKLGGKKALEEMKTLKRRWHTTHTSKQEIWLATAKEDVSFLIGEKRPLSEELVLNNLKTSQWPSKSREDVWFPLPFLPLLRDPVKVID